MSQYTMFNEKLNSTRRFPSRNEAVLRPDGTAGLDIPDFLSREACERLLAQAINAAQGGGDVMLQISSSWTANLRWARNRVQGTGDTRNHRIMVTRTLNKTSGQYSVNQCDHDAIVSAVQYAEWVMMLKEEGDSIPPYKMNMAHLQPNIWSETTYRLNAEARSDAAQPLMDLAEQAGMLSAGYLQLSAGGWAVFTSGGLRRYYPFTQAQYSVTVRESTGAGSGWAGVDFSDWGRIDATALTERALRKCLTSVNPVRIEPGRYTAILEPQAVADLFNVVIRKFDRVANEEKPDMPFFLHQGQSKIGLKLFDERINVTADVMDPDLGWVPFDFNGEPYLPAVWIKDGVLRNLAYDHRYAVESLGVNEPMLNSFAYRMAGGNTTIDEMIASTKRGVLVTRFSNIDVVDDRSLLCTGYTRDGLWLIENGAISKAVRNFRFTESPLFAFLNVRQIGPAQRVFSPTAPVVVPSMKVDDFSFTSLTDAV